MTNFKYDKNFYKVPLPMFYDEGYSTISTHGKMMYVLFTDTNKLSKNSAENNNTQFYDENGELYSIYSNEDLAIDLNVSKRTVMRLKKELKEHGLLKEVQRGSGLSNLIYPQELYANKTCPESMAKYINKWFLLPKDLFAYDYYHKDLDNASKFFYSIMFNTFLYSAEKGKCVKDDFVYCNMTYKKACEITGFGKSTIKSCKNKLKKKHLLNFEKGGFLKPDNFYVFLPQPSKNMSVTKSKTWSHLINKQVKVKKFSSFSNVQKHGFKFNKNIIVTDQEQQKCQMENAGSDISGITEVTNGESNNTYSNNNYINNTYSNDMYDVYKEYNELVSEESNQSNQMNQKHELKTNENQEDQIDIDFLLRNYPEHLSLSLKRYDADRIEFIKEKLKVAKQSYNNSTMDKLTFEDCEYDLAKLVKNLKDIAKIKKESIFDMGAYIVKSVKKIFKSAAAELFGQNESEESVLLDSTQDTGNESNYIPKIDWLNGNTEIDKSQSSMKMRKADELDDNTSNNLCSAKSKIPKFDWLNGESLVF